MVKVIQISVLVSMIVILSSFGLATNFQAPFENVNQEPKVLKRLCLPGMVFSSDPNEIAKHPFGDECKYYKNKQKDTTTALSSALASSNTGTGEVTNDAYALFTSSTPIKLDNKPINQTKKLQNEDN